MRGPMGGWLGPAAEGEELQGLGRAGCSACSRRERGLVIAVLAMLAPSRSRSPCRAARCSGAATDIIFEGFLGTRPAGANPTDLARGDARRGPAQGIDFGALAGVLALVMALYAGAVAVHVAAGLHAQPASSSASSSGCAPTSTRS